MGGGSLLRRALWRPSRRPGFRDERLDPQAEEGAQLDELVGPHGALAVEDAPEPFAFDADAPRELGNADPAMGARLLQPHRDAALVADHSVFSRRRAIALLLPA